MFRFPQILLDADDGAAGGNTPNEAQNSGQKQEQAPDYGKILESINLDDFFKQDAVAKKIQSIADARVTQALTTAKTKWEREQEEAKDEATKLAKMTEAEKAKYQFEKDKAAFEAEKTKFAHEQLQVETAKQLISAGLPDLSQYITGKDAEETKANITTLQSILGAWKSDAIKKMTAGHTPNDVKAGNKITSKAELSKMSAAEINAAYESGQIDLKNLK